VAIAMENGVDILVQGTLLRAGLFTGGKKAESALACSHRLDALCTHPRHQVKARARQAGGLQQRTQEVFVDIHGRGAGTGIERHQFARKENRIDLLARIAQGSHVGKQRMQHGRLGLLIATAQAHVGKMEGGKFFHCCKTFSVQPGLTESSNVDGEIIRRWSSRNKTLLSERIVPFFL